MSGYMISTVKLCANTGDLDQTPLFGSIQIEMGYIIAKWSVLFSLRVAISKTRLFKYVETFTSKNWKFQMKNSDIFKFLLKT